MLLLEDDSVDMRGEDALGIRVGLEEVCRPGVLNPAALAEGCCPEAPDGFLYAASLCSLATAFRGEAFRSGTGETQAVDGGLMLPVVPPIIRRGLASSLFLFGDSGFAAPLLSAAGWTLTGLLGRCVPLLSCPLVLVGLFGLWLSTASGCAILVGLLGRCGCTMLREPVLSPPKDVAPRPATRSPCAAIELALDAATTDPPLPLPDLLLPTVVLALLDNTGACKRYPIAAIPGHCMGASQVVCGAAGAAADVFTSPRMLATSRLCGDLLLAFALAACRSGD
mmetsp:Transcript_34690/g.79477  ORF Transcript_34690/g.79477 Transcript_34690/m.79477 type:complete len:281 (+) Transcript_34690:1125-1967(+)